jgi:hypothetical protein
MHGTRTVIELADGLLFLLFNNQCVSGSFSYSSLNVDVIRNVRPVWFVIQIYGSRSLHRHQLQQLEGEMIEEEIIKTWFLYSCAFQLDANV